jgi:hypothetical protein
MTIKNVSALCRTYCVFIKKASFVLFLSHVFVLSAQATLQNDAPKPFKAQRTELKSLNDLCDVPQFLPKSLNSTKPLNSVEEIENLLKNLHLNAQKPATKPTYIGSTL